jgi:chemotaxis protein CheY-P-specific phosphatase CheC
MSEQNERDVLSEVTARVFQQTAFLFPEPADLSSGIPAGEGAVYSVSLSFSGDREGEVSLVVTEALCRELAANVLGEDPAEDDSLEKALDAAKETLNIIAGQFLIQIFGNKALFNLTAPQVTELTPEQAAAIDLTDRVCSLVEGHPVIAAATKKSGTYEHTRTGC